MVTNMLAAVLLQLTGAATLGANPIVSYFPGPYFDAEGNAQLEAVALETWPGPSSLLSRWRQGDLSEEERVTLLLGAAAFRDPQLLGLYREAIRSDSRRLRAAAVYGYRQLICDQVPDVTSGVSDGDARLLEAEMRAVDRTLRSRPLIAMWLEALLHADGSGLPGYRGVVLERPDSVAVRAIEKLMHPEDLDLLVTAFESTTRRQDRISLLKLIEGLTLSTFVTIPKGPRAAWSARDSYDHGLRRLDASIVQWRHGHCRIDFEAVVAANLARMGAGPVRPLAPEACGLWLRVLQKGRPEWAGLAAQRLYACGGPWVEISVVRADSPSEQQKRRYLLNWYTEKP